MPDCTSHWQDIPDKQCLISTCARFSTFGQSNTAHVRHQIGGPDLANCRRARFRRTPALMKAGLLVLARCHPERAADRARRKSEAKHRHKQPRECRGLHRTSKLHISDYFAHATSSIYFSNSTAYLRVEAPAGLAARALSKGALVLSGSYLDSNLL